MRLTAPAKINLYLRIVGQRADGYHLLDSLMLPVSLYDTIHLQGELVARRGRGSAITVTCDDPAVPSDATNLACKAAALLCQEAGVQARLTLHLHKRIPAGAGLGGGSSDAAAVLKGVNILLALGFGDSQLGALASRLGADVGFFIPCRPAIAAGIGDVLTAVAPLPQRWVVLVVPPFGVSTPWAYRRFDALAPPPQAPGPAALTVPGQWPAPECLVNDLERAVLPEYPVLAQLKTHLYSYGAEVALMSGSGSAVFGIFLQPDAAARACHGLQEHGKAFLVRILDGPPGEAIENS
jgi:4-diphosphocytidyl-2-C-methyl-D-erythritol kinase